jgi:phospholipid/cholesterol/gamma-HCH transport system substrate-binding protein
MKKTLSKEFIIGACVIAALVILFVGIDFLKGINIFKPANFYYASYSNVAGLELAAPVTIDGYKVGQVRDIEFNYENPGTIKVQLALNKQLKVPEGTVAVIESGLLSGAYVNLKLGNSTKYVEVGSEIQTSSAPDLMASVSQEILPSVSSVLTKVDTLLYNVNNLASHPALTASIQRLDGISYNLLSATGGLNTTLTRQTPLLMNSVGKIAVNLDTITTDLTKFSASLNNLPLDATMENVNRLTENLIAFSNQLNNQKSTLGLLMNDPELYNRLNQISADVDSLIVDIKKNPKRYISIKLL